jgi:hypothetical protein
MIEHEKNSKLSSSGCREAKFDLAGLRPEEHLIVLVWQGNKLEFVGREGQIPNLTVCAQ